jgi:hypothetical protein
LAALSAEYRHDPTTLRWDVKAFEAVAEDPGLGAVGVPWTLRASPDGTFTFLVVPGNAVFQSATLTPLDALLAELAASASDFLRDRPNPPSFGRLLADLRLKYATSSQLDPAVLAADATQTLNALAKSLAKNVDGDTSQALFGALSASEREEILSKMAIVGAAKPQEAIAAGRFLEFASRRTLLRFFRANPELFFDGKYFEEPYITLNYGSDASTEAARARVLTQYEGLLNEVVWLEGQDPDDIVASRSRLLRAYLAIELLSSSGDD